MLIKKGKYLKYFFSIESTKIFFLLIFSLILNSCKFVQGESSSPDTPTSQPTQIQPPQSEDIKPKVEISVNKGNSFFENEGVLLFKAKLSEPLKQDIKLTISYSGSFTANDFTNLSTEVIILKEQIETDIAINITNDTIIEPTKSISVTFSTPQDVELNKAVFGFTLFDDETFYVEIEEVNSEMIENNLLQPAEYNFAIYDENYNPLTLDFDINLKVIDMQGTLADSDISGVFRQVTIPAGASVYNLKLYPVDNLVKSAIKKATITYELVNAAASPYSNRSMNLSLIDDDQELVRLDFSGNCYGLKEGIASTCAIIVKRFFSTASNLTVNLLFSGTALPSTDYTGNTSSVIIPAGQDQTSFNITPVNDSVWEDTESIRIEVASGDYYFDMDSAKNFSIQDNDATPEKRSINLSVVVNNSPATITLSWPTDINFKEYQVYRKELGSATWGSVIATLPAGTTSYTDSTVAINTTYEYKISRWSGEGYVVAAIERPVIHQRGNLLVVAESTIASNLVTEIDLWLKVLAGDGWNVKVITVLSTDSVVSVKQKIKNEFDLWGFKNAVLFGHVPVPYSGALAPDGHGDHNGAWPTDLYYADLDGEWTDTTVNTSSASRTKNRNIPGDGKWDQNTVPTDVEFAVGRIDFYDMPAFAPLTEIDLLRRYLQKNINYRNVVTSVNRRALIDDNFGDFSGEAFSSSAWGWFSSSVGRANIVTLDFATELKTNNYLWAYGCGGGTYTSAGGIGSTTDFVNNPVKAVFTALFGSYFGDWDSTNNFLKAPLAADGMALTSVWSGRPRWTFHGMAIGEPIGTSILAYQNANSSNYFGKYGTSIHEGFIGDSTLRDRMIEPVSNVRLVDQGATYSLSWNPSVATGIQGYYIYGSNNKYSNYELIGGIISSSNVNLNKTLNYKYYQVRAARLEVSPSGSYHNLSTGVLIEAP